MSDNNIPLSFVNPELEFNLELDTNNRINKLQSELNLPEYKLNLGNANTQYFPEFKPKFNFENNEVLEGKKLFDAQFSADPTEAAKARELMNKKFDQDFIIKNDLRAPTLTPVEQTKRYTSEKEGFIPNTDNEDFYYGQNWETKGFFNKAGTITKNVLGRVATGAVLKFGQGFGYLGSMVSNIGQDDYWGKVADNGFSKALEEAEEYTKQELFKVYKSANYDNKGLFSKFGDATFWQDEVADGVAFMGSAFIPMGILGKAGQAAKFGRLAFLGTDLASTTAVGRTAGTVLDVTFGSKNILGITGHVYSVASEAGFEAADTYKQAIRSGLSKEEAGQKASQAYLGNVAVLTFSNAFENKMVQKVLNRGIKGEAKHSLNFADDMSINAEKASTKMGKFFSENTWGERLKFYGKQAGKGFLAEGLWEENAQLAIQRIASGEYEVKERGTGITTTKKAGNFVEQVFTNIKDAALGKDVEAETSIGIGAIIGIGGGVISSKIAGDRKKDKAEKLATIANLTETRNNWLKNNIYETNEDGSLKDGKLTIDPAKVAVRDQKIAEMTSKLNMAKELEGKPELKAFVERSAFTDFALAHIKNGSIDFLIDKLENWNTEDKETLAAYGFSQEQQEDISPKKFAEIARDLNTIYSKAQDAKYNKPTDMSTKDAINYAYLAKEAIFQQQAYIYHIESILNEGFKQFEDPKFREYKTLLQEKAQLESLSKETEAGIDVGNKKMLDETNTKIKDYESKNKGIVGEFNKLDKTKKELEKTLNGEIVGDKKVDGYRDVLAKLSDKETGLTYVQDDYNKKVEQAAEKVKEVVKKTTENKVDVIAKFFEKNTKVKSIQDLKDKLNAYYKEKGDNYPIEEVRKRLLGLYKEALELADNEDLSVEQRKDFEELINSLVEIGKKNNTLDKKTPLSKEDADKLRAVIPIIDTYRRYVAKNHTASKDFLSTVPPFIKNLDKTKLGLLTTDLLNKLSNKSYVFTEEDYKSVFGIAPKKENIQNTSIITDPNLITKIKDIAKNILSYNGMIQKNLKPSEEFLKSIPEHIKNLSLEDSKKINLIVYDILFKNKPITTENAELILGISLGTPNNKSNVPKNAIITDIQRQYKIVKPTKLIEEIKYLTEEEIANGLTIELVENVDQPFTVLEKESNESYKVTLSNPTALGEKWIVLKYKGELVGYLNSPDVFTYNTPRGIVKAEDLTKEEFEIITKNLNEYDRFINDARQYRILHANLLKQQAGSIKDILNLIISEGEYDYAENEQEALSLEELYEKYPNMVIFNRTTRTKDGSVIYNTIDPETPLLTAEQDIEAEAFIKTLNQSSRYGRFVAAILLPNGKFKAIQLKAPKFTDEQLDTYFDNLKTTLAEIDVLSQGEVLQAEDKEAREEIRSKFNESLTPFVAIDPGSKPSTSYVDIEFNISFPEKSKSKSPVFQVSIETLGDKTKGKKVFIPLKEIEGKTTDEIIAVINTALANVGQKIVLTRSSFLYPVKTDVSFNKALEQLKTNVKPNVFKNPTVKIKIENPQIFTPGILTKADEVSKEPEPEIIDPIEALKQPTSTTQTDIEAKKAVIERRKQALKDIMEATGEWAFINGVSDGTFAGEGLLNMNDNGDVILTRFADSEEGLTKGKGKTENLASIAGQFGGEQIATSGVEGGLASFSNGIIGEYHIPLNELISLIKEGYIVFAGLGNKEFVLSPHIADKYLSKINGKQINAKYDAELKALEQSTSTNQSESKTTDVTINPTLPSGFKQRKRGEGNVKFVKPKDSIANDKLIEEDIEDINSFISYLKKILPANLFEVNKWNSPQKIFGTNNIKVGSFLARLDKLNNVIGTIGYYGSKAKYHEAFHGIFNMLLSNEEQDKLVKAAYVDIYKELAKKGTTYVEDVKRFIAENPERLSLSKEELKKLYAEEWLADKFQDFKDSNKNDSVIMKFFKNLWSFIQSIFSEPNEIERFFKDVDNGKFQGRVLAHNSYTNAVREFGIPSSRDKIEIGNLVYSSDNYEYTGSIYLPYNHHQLLMGTLFNNFILDRQNPDITETNKNALLDRTLDKIYKYWDDLVTQFEETGEAPGIIDDASHEMLYKYVDMLNPNTEEGLRIRRDIKEEVNKLLSYIGYRQDLDSEEQDDKVDEEGDRRTTSSYSDSENFGGFRSASLEFRQYLMTFVNESRDMFGNQPEEGSGFKFFSAPNVPTLYNGLLKATANAGTLSDVIFLKQLQLFAEDNTEAKGFYTKFLDDVGLTNEDVDNAYNAYNNKEEFTLKVTDSTKFKLVTSTLHTHLINYLIIESDISKNSKTSRVITANNRNSANIQLEQWNNDFTRITNMTSEVKVREAQKELNRLKTLLNGEYKIKSRAETRLKIKDIRDKIYNQLGIKFSPLYIEYSLYMSLDPETLPVYASEILSLYDNITPIESVDIEQITNSIKEGENPFISDKDIAPMVDDENELDTPQDNGDVNNYGTKGRLFKLAKSNSNFDENVWGSVFKNAANDNVWQHQAPTFTLTQFEKIKNSVLDRSYKTIMKTGFKDIMKKVSIERISGSKIVTFYEGKEGNLQLNNKLDVNKKPGTTYGDFQGAELYHTLHVLYFAGRTFLTKRGNKSSEVSTTKHLLRIYEASNTGDVTEMPVTKTTNVVDGKIKLSDTTLDLFFDLLDKEMESGRLLLYKNFANDSGQDVLNLFYIDGKVNDKGEGKLKKSLDNNEKIALRDKLNQYISESLFEEYFRDLLEKDLIDVENGNIINKYLPSEIFGKLNNNDTKTHVKKLHINIEETIIENGQPKKTPLTNLQIRENLAQVFFSDFINTALFNDMLHEGSQSLVYKDYVDMIKRAKGLNAGGVSFYSEITNSKLGINHKFTEVDVITLKEQTRFSKVSGSNSRASADGQGEATIKWYRYYLHSLGRLDKKTASLLDKIEKGEDEIDDVFGDNGLIELHRQLHAVKIVYFDGINYYKLSVRVLAPRLSSYKDKNGKWQPLPHREEEHYKRLQLEKHESNGRVGMLLDSSASKTMIKNINYNSLQEFIEEKKDLKHVVKSTDYLRLQTENPSNKNTVVNPSQSKQILDGEQDETAFIPTVNKTVGQVMKDFSDAMGQKYKISYLQSRNNIFDLTEADLKDELTNSIKVNKISSNLDKFRELAVRNLESTGANDALITYFKQDYNLNNPLTREKFEQLFIAYFNNGGFKDKVPGHALTLASANNISLMKKVKAIHNYDGKRVVEWEVIYTHTVNNSMEKGENTYKNVTKRYSTLTQNNRQAFEDTLEVGDLFIDEPQYNVPVYNKEGKIISHYSEAIVPAHFREFEYNLRKGKSIPIRILEALGVRIPSQDKHSNASLRFVDFAPAYMGSTVFVPDEILEISGGDFDVDKLYTHIRDFFTKYNKESNKYDFVEYGKTTDTYNQYEEYVLWNIKNNKDYIDAKNTISTKYKNERTKLEKKLKDLKDEFTDYENYVNEVLTDLRNNEENEEAQLLEDFWKENILADFKEKNAISKESKKHLRDTFGMELEPISQETRDEIEEIILKLKTITEKIQVESFQYLKLPSNFIEYQAYKAKHGEPNIGALNNKILDSKILLLTNENIINRGVDLETAEATFFTSTKEAGGVKNHPILKDQLRPDSKYEVDSFMGKVSHFIANKMGASNIAPAVNNMLISFFMNKNNIMLNPGTDENPNWVPIISKNGVEKVYDNFSNNVTESGRRVFNIISQIVTLMTDNAKERAAYSNNLTMETIPAFVYGLSLGINEMDLQALVLKPSVIELVNKLQENKVSNNLEKKSIAEVTAGVLGKFFVETTDTVLTEEELYNFDKDTTDPIRQAKYKEANYKALVFFVKLSEQAQIASSLIDILKLTKGLNNGFETLISLKDAREKLGLFGEPNEMLFLGLDKAIKNTSHVNTLLRQADQIAQISGNIVLSQTNLFKNLIAASFNQMTIRSYIDRQSFRKTYVNDFISYLTTLSFMKQHQVRKTVNAQKGNKNELSFGDYLTNDLILGYDSKDGRKTILHDLARARVLFKEIYGKQSKLLNKFLVGNPYLIKVPKKVTNDQGIEEIVYEYHLNKNNKMGFDTMLGNTYSKLDEAETNDMHSDFRQMWNAYDEKQKEKSIELQEIARKFYAYLIVKDGHQFKSKGISAIIPPEITKPYINRLNYINDLFSRNPLTEVQKFNQETKDDFIKYFGKDFLTLLTDYNLMYLTHKSNGNKVKFIKKTLNTTQKNKKDLSAKTVTEEKGNLIIDLFGGTPTYNKTDKQSFLDQLNINIEGLKDRGFFIYTTTVDTKEGTKVKSFVNFPLVIKSGSKEDTRYYMLEQIGTRKPSEQEKMSSFDLKNMDSINKYYNDNLNIVGQKAVYRKMTGLVGFEYQTPIAALFGEQKVEKILKETRVNKKQADIPKTNIPSLPLAVQTENTSTEVPTVLNNINEKLLQIANNKLGGIMALKGPALNPESDLYKYSQEFKSLNPEELQAKATFLFKKVVQLKNKAYQVTKEDIQEFAPELLNNQSNTVNTNNNSTNILTVEQEAFAKNNSIEQNFFDGKAYHKGKDSNGKDIWGYYKIKNGIKSSIEGALKGFRTQTTRSVSQIEQLKAIAKNQGITNGVIGTIVWMEDKGDKSPTKGKGGWFKITSEPYTPNKEDFNNYENWEENVWDDRSSEFKIGTKDEWKSVRFEVLDTNNNNIVNNNITFEEEQSSGYAERTRKNASADATIAIAVDFNSAGEKLTKTSVLNQGKKYIPINVSDNLSDIGFRASQIVEQLNSINTDEYKWSRYSDNSYEVSSQGDKRFSALFAKLKDGRTIEEAYQLDVKGYRQQSNNWKEGKGKAPIIPFYNGNITPTSDTIFVFGSNPEGRHGAGAAKVAKDQFGAVYGQGEGLQGNAYALPTKDLRVKENNGYKSISPNQIIESIKKLYEVAKQNPTKKFKIAYTNTTEPSLNGYTGLEMIEMFNSAGERPSNIVFSKEWVDTKKIKPISKEQSWIEYKALWKQYLNENPDLEKELREKAQNKVLTDKFASTDISQARALSEILNEKSTKGISLNIAGNGIYTMKGKYTQEQVDDFTYELLNRVINSPNLKTKIESIRSGGQTGFDEAGTKAGIKLGLPTLTLAPKGWKFRDINGVDISNEQQFKKRFKVLNTNNNQNVNTEVNTQSTPTFTAKQLWYINKAVITDAIPGITLGVLEEMEREQGIEEVIDFIKKCKGVKI